MNAAFLTLLLFSGTAAFAGAERKFTKSSHRPVVCAAYKKCGVKQRTCGKDELCVSVQKGCGSALCMADPCQDLCGVAGGKCAMAKSYPVQIVCENKEK